MLLTAIDSTSVNTGEADIGIEFKSAEKATPQPLRLSTSLRNRASLPPAREGATYEPLRQDFYVFKRPGSSLDGGQFNRLVYSVFAPAPQERVLTGQMEDEVTLTNRAVIVSFGEANFSEWHGTFEFLDPVWSETSLQESSANPLEVGGTGRTRPLVEIESGDEVTRQMLVITDRTGHGVGSLLVAVTPDEDLPEANYIIHCEGTPQPFIKDGGRLYFRVSVQADTLPTLIDIHQGTDIDGSRWAGQLERFGVALDTDVPNWKYNVDTATARDNGLAPAMAWTPAVTGDPPPRRSYSFGMVGEWIHLRDDNVGETEQALSNDVDGLTILTGVEAKKISNLSLEVRTGYQPAASGSTSGTGKKRRVMRCTLIVDSTHGEHYAQWSLGPVTFPRTGSHQSNPLTSVYPIGTYIPQNASILDAVTMYEVRTSTETVWRNLASVRSFANQVRHYFPSVEVTQGAEGVFYLDFGEVDYEIPLMSMSVHPVVRSRTHRWQRDLPDTVTGVRRSARASVSRTSHWLGNVPGIFWESIWVDPVTKRPFEDDPDTAHLLPYAVHGQARLSVVYWLRDSPYPIEAWSQTVTSGNGPRTQSFNNLSLDIPGAVQVAVRLEPVSNRFSYANWGRFRVTSVPQIELDDDLVPDIEISEAIPALQIDGTLTNTTTGESLRLENVLVDEPGISLDMASGDFRPISGIGEWHGRIYPSAGSGLVSLDPRQDNAWSVTGNIDAEDVTWAWYRRVVL